MPATRVRFCRFLTVLGLITVTACRVWSPAQLDPQHGLPKGRVRLSRADGSSLVMVDPRLEGDSVAGTWAGSQARVAIARADIKRIDVYRVDRATTVLAGLGIVAILIAIALFSD